MPDPVAMMSPVSDSKMKGDLSESGFKQINANGDAQQYALGTASVIRVDYEKLEVSLRIQSGETFQNIPIAITFPGAGRRHFLGALPEVGDACVIGWGMLESGKTKQPYIISWIVPGTTPGHDWWPVQPMGPEEFNLTPKDRILWEGTADRFRHKLRHMLPGNVLASSSQGSDFVLDEGVLLTSRRGNEIILRDQDQALITRSLQQFHLSSGTRIYSGMVQRDATLLPSSLFTDGTLWDSSQQTQADGTPLTQYDLPSTTSGVLRRDVAFDKISLGVLDPKAFLQNGLFIDGSGGVIAQPDGVINPAHYNGKDFYRVSSGLENQALDANAQALTEYRVEVSHTADGRLPVSEQTDGFDVDRLPPTTPNVTSPFSESNSYPFIEFVMGSVVGNDAFSLDGRSSYGLPLLLDNATFKSAIGVPIQRHLGLLFKVRDPEDPSSIPGVIAMTKDGQIQMVSSGKNPASLNFQSGVTFSGGGVAFNLNRPFHVHTVQGGSTDGIGVSLQSDKGAVRIYGGGKETLTGLGVSISSATQVGIQGSGGVQLSGSSVAVENTLRFAVSAQSAIVLQAGDAISQVSKTRDQTTLGKSVETFSGPTDGLATNGPVREIQIVAVPATGFLGGTADKYVLNFGDRDELIRLGDHKTHINVGDMFYETDVGKQVLRAGLNSIEQRSSGTNITTLTGNGDWTVASGGLTLSASASIGSLAAGTNTVRGGVVVLSATGGKVGGIVSGADLDPLSGLPLASLGMGSLTQTLTL